MCSHRSESEPQRPLHDSGRPRSVQIAEIAIGLNPCRRKYGGSVNGAELRMIENVVRLPAKSEYPFFASEVKVPEKGRVEVNGAGSTERISRCAADLSQQRKLHAGSLEKRGHASA